MCYRIDAISFYATHFCNETFWNTLQKAKYIFIDSISIKLLVCLKEGLYIKAKIQLIVVWTKKGSANIKSISINVT